MKLVKLFNKLSAVALAASLVVGFASCSTTTDDPFNPNAPLTLEEYVKSEIKKAIENGGAQAKPEDPSKPGKPSGSLKETKSLEFHVNADSTNAENTMIFVKYDRSAYGAEEEVKVTDAELNLYINDVKVKTYNEIVFVLDEYGAEITSRGPIEDPKAMKEYKAKLSVGKAVKSGETVKIELVKASVVKVGAASDKITLANLQFALIDTDPSVDYYKELAPNEEQFQNICTLEDLTTGEDTESKPGEEQKPSENPTPTPDEKPEPEDSGLLPKAADLSWGTPVSVAGSSFESATDNSSIKITYVSNKDTAQYYKFKMMCGNGNENELFAGDATGFTIDKESVDNLDNLHGCGFDVAPSETPAVITYKPSTEEWAKIKAGEFRLIGNGAKITKIELEAAAGGEEPAPTPDPEPTPDPKPTPAPGEEPTPAPGEEETPVKSIELVKNPYAEGGALQTQVKIPSELTSLSVGDKVKVTFSGTADREIGNVELMIVDTTETASWWTALSETKKDTFSTDINFDFEFVITKAPIGTGADSMVLAINGLDSDEAATIKCTSFSIEKIANEKPAGGENNAGGEGDNGAGESTSKTYGLCKKYTVTTTKDVAAGNFAFVLQIDNDGEQSEDGLKIDVTDFEMEVKVGEEEPFTFTRDKIAMIPNQWASPNYGVTDCRFKLDGEKTIPSGTVITVQVKKATVSNKEKADSIIYIFNEDGVGGQYGQYVAPSDNYKSIFAANEI